MVAVGTVQYSLGTSPVTGLGVALSDEELDSSLAGPVAALVFDDEGKADIDSLLAGLPETEFDQELIRGTFSDSGEPEDWRVGEALAESYLVHNKDCTFPWPDGRDERKSGSSLPGADLVGFHNDGESDRFAFGEIKTSSDKNYPPGAMYGQTGLKQQLEDLRNSNTIRQDLVKYLGHRAINATWKTQFQNAAAKFLKDSNDVRVFGVMIRDVAPHEDDLRVRVTKLGTDCPESMEMQLFAIYIPQDSIATLSEKVVQSRTGGES